MDKSFVKDWFKHQYDISIDTAPPFSLVLDEVGGKIYPRDTSTKFEFRSDRDKLKYYRMLLPSELKDIIAFLIDYCNRYTDEDIKTLNEFYRKKIEEDFEKSDDYQEWYKYWFEPVEPQYYAKASKWKEGYIYMAKCRDAVKIGFSKDVEKRIKQLDVKPFKTELVFKVYNEKAYQIEQQIHKCLEDYRIEGEWYTNKITEELVRNMIEVLDEEMGIVEGE